MSDLDNLFEANGDRGHQRLHALLTDPQVKQITCNSHDRVSFIDATGTKRLEGVFAGPAQYVDWLNYLLTLTDVGFTDVTKTNTSVVEGSFLPSRTPVPGSIHICTTEITRSDPSLVIRKQPPNVVSLDQMYEQGMMSADMRAFLEQAVRGRSNILISGGSGAGKTTMARAMSQFIDPAQRLVTVEEIDELKAADRLPDVVSLTSVRRRDSDGRMIRETTLDDLVRESLRMRADRVWVGETRGKEAYALVKACNSGHDGSITTIHADDGRQAFRQVVTYVMESGMSEQPAREQVAQAFDLVVQINQVEMGRRAITEITELENVLEKSANQRQNVLYSYDPVERSFIQESRPTVRFLRKWQRYGVNYDGVHGRA